MYAVINGISKIPNILCTFKQDSQIILHTIIIFLAIAKTNLVRFPLNTHHI